MINLDADLARLETKIDLILMELQKRDKPNASDEAERAFKSLTTKQHACCQMLVAGVSNEEIADILGVQLGSAKVHVRAANKKFGVNRRSQTALAYKAVADGVAAEEYMIISGGLPADWYPEHVADEKYLDLLSIRAN